MARQLKTIKRGFTLVEIVCSLIIISIISSIALPAVSNFHSSEKVKAEASILVSYIRQARYQAIQENSLNRIIFSQDDPNLFKVQVCNVNNPEEKSFTDFISDMHGKIGNSEGNYDIHSYWESIADEEEIELDPSVEITIPNAVYNGVIYFSSDGYLYVVSSSAVSSTAEKISEINITFKYGSANLVLALNSMGVISSQAYAEDDTPEANDAIW